MMRKLVSFAVIASLFSCEAEAAILTDLQGSVSVNHGSGFTQVTAPVAVAPGDRVRVNGGAANIVYENGCTVSVGPDQVVLVLSNAPECHRVGFKDGAAVDSEFPSSTLLIGAVVAGAGVGTAIALSQPASP